MNDSMSVTSWYWNDWQLWWDYYDVIVTIYSVTIYGSCYCCYYFCYISINFIVITLDTCVILIVSIISILLITYLIIFIIVVILIIILSIIILSCSCRHKCTTSCHNCFLSFAIVLFRLITQMNLLAFFSSLFLILHTLLFLLLSCLTIWWSHSIVIFTSERSDSSIPGCYERSGWSR